MAELGSNSGAPAPKSFLYSCVLLHLTGVSPSESLQGFRGKLHFRGLGL